MKPGTETLADELASGRQYRFATDDIAGLGAIEHVTIQLAKLTERKAPRLLVDLSDYCWPLDRLRQSVLLKPSLGRERLKDALLTWGDLFFVDHQLKTSLMTPSADRAALVADNPQNELIYRSAGIRRDTNGFFVDPMTFSKVIEVPEKVVFGTSEEPGNWGLWLLRTLHAANHFQQNRGNYDRLFCYAHVPTMRDMLKLAGIHDSDLLPHLPWNTYAMKDVTFFRQQFRDLTVGPDLRSIINIITAKVGDSRFPKKVFVSRRSLTHNGHYRPLMNEDDLCRLATSLGFFVAEPEKLTAAEQVQLFHGAEKVIGLGGAGMFNAIFCKAGTQLLDIESTNAFLDGHSQLFASADLDYGIIVGSEDRTDARSDHRRWTLDLARLGPLIEGFFK